MKCGTTKGGGTICGSNEPTIDAAMLNIGIVATIALACALLCSAGFVVWRLWMRKRKPSNDQHNRQP